MFGPYFLVLIPNLFLDSCRSLSEFNVVLYLVKKVDLFLLVVIGELGLSTESATSASCSTAVEVRSSITSSRSGVQVGVLGYRDVANVLSTSVCGRSGVGIGTSVGKTSVRVGEAGIGSSTCYTSVDVLCQSRVDILGGSSILSCSSVDVLGSSSVGICGSIGGWKVLVIQRYVIDRTLLTRSGGTGSRSSSSTSHLNWDTATEWTSTSGVLAADHADIRLSSNGSCAGLTGRDLSSKREILHLSVPVSSTSVALKVLADSDWLPVSTSSGCIDHALVGTRSITVDLMNSHHDLSTSGDLRESATVELHDLGGTRLNVVVASTKSLTTRGSSIATEASGVLLERVAACTIARSGWDDTNSRTLTTSIASGTDDCTVASHERRRSQKAKGNNGRSGEVHSEPVR